MMIAAILGAGMTMVSAERSDAGTCAALRPVITAAQTCADAPHGVIIASGGARAKDLAGIAATAEARFVLRFRHDVPRYAVVETESGGRDAMLDAALEQRGFVWRLPWLSPEAMVNGYRASISRAVTAQAQARQLGTGQTAAMVEAALAQQAARWTPAALREREEGTLPHELGHGWFIRAFWSGAPATTGDHYGGPAPDWMDETAAVLMEDEALANKRRHQFAAIHAGEDVAAKARLLDLATFLSGGHPALPKLDLPGGSGGVKVLTGAEAAGVAAVAGNFYLQARLFADYLIDRSGSPAAFRSAADAFATGKTTAQWLVADAAKLRVPATIEALESDWKAWLIGRISKTPS